MKVTYLQRYLIDPYESGTIVPLKDMPPLIRWHLVLSDGSPDEGYINYYSEDGTLYDDKESKVFEGRRARDMALGDRRTWANYSGIII